MQQAACQADATVHRRFGPVRGSFVAPVRGIVDRAEVSVIGLWAALAHAANVIDMGAMTTVTHGEQAPYVEFHVGEPGELSAELTCGGRTWRLDQRVSQGQTVRLELTGIAEGVHDCAGSMRFALDRGEEVSQSLALNVASLGMIRWNISYAEDFDHAGKAFTAHASRPLVAARARFLGAHGKQVDFAEADLSDPLAPRFAWTTGETVVKIEVEGEDAHGFRGLLEVFPYFYSIPHEDPVFDSGSHAILPSEEPKLRDTWAKIVEQFELYGSVIEMDLYVAGYTDTVGSAASNQALSERRARSIAQWFRQAGFRGAVYYQGFGESALAVPTGDEVDEIRNRRVVYFLANQPPPPSRDVPRSDWRKL